MTIKGPFSIKMEEFLTECTLPEEAKKHLRAELIRSVLKLLDRKGTLSARAYARKYNCLEKFTFFREQYLSISKYIHRDLWTGVIEFHNKEIIPNDQALFSDITYCLSNLEKTDHKNLKKMKINPNLNIDHIKIDEKWRIGKKVKHKLMDFIKSRTNTLQYLSQYDGALSQEDFQQEIACEMFKIVNLYPKLQSDGDDADVEDKLQRYISVSVNNKVLNIKGYYDHSSRRRIVSTIEPLYKEMKKFKRLHADALKTETKICETNNLEYHWIVLCLAKRYPETKWDSQPIETLREEFAKIRNDTPDQGYYVHKVCDLPYKSKEYLEKLQGIKDKIKNSNSDYYSTVTSIVSDGDIDDEPSNFTDPSNSFEAIENNLWVDNICNRVKDGNLSRFIRIVTGSEDKEFETWATSNNINTSNFDSLLKGAKKYLKISQTKLQSDKTLEKIVKEVLHGKKRSEEEKQQPLWHSK
jgi:hypothetical protein